MKYELETKAFQKAYLLSGGCLNFLTLVDCDDDIGEYKPDWNRLEKEDVQNDADLSYLITHAKEVTTCLKVWIGYVKFNAIPEGYVLMPKEATQELIEHEMQGKVLPAVMGSYERAVDNFKTRYKAMVEKQEEINKQASLSKF